MAWVNQTTLVSSWNGAESSYKDKWSEWMAYTSSWGGLSTFTWSDLEGYTFKDTTKPTTTWVAA